jgi:Flp pilus assembly protein TadD
MQRRRFGRIAAATFGIIVAAALSGCAKGTAVGSHGGVTVTGSTVRSDTDLRQALDTWGARYDQAPKDRAVIMNYAAALRLNGQTEQAVAVLGKGKIEYPEDQELGAAYGKALAENGDFAQALSVIQAVQRADRPDWKLYSAEGAILDQMGRPAVARDRYSKALAIAPGEPTILNNLALSYLLAGEMQEAEKILRDASQSEKATSRIRQNLALVVGLQGRYEEAEQIARSELDPEQAEANIAYLRTMMSQADTYRKKKQAA